MTKKIKNIAASVKAKLLNYAKREGIVFTDKFMNDEIKKIQWKAFLKKTTLVAEDDFTTVASQIRHFLHPVIKTIVSDEPFAKTWEPQKFQWV